MTLALGGTSAPPRPSSRSPQTAIRTHSSTMADSELTGASELSEDEEWKSSSQTARHVRAQLV